MAKARTPGRPQHGDTPKTQALNLKTTVELRDLLEKAAAESGRSLTKEVERRLSSSFGLSEAAAAGNLAQLFRRISTLIETVELRTGKVWTEDAATFWAVRAGILEFIDRTMPDDPDFVLMRSRISSEADPDTRRALELAETQRLKDLEKSGTEVARMIQPLTFINPGLKASNLTAAPWTLEPGTLGWDEEEK